MVIGSLIVERQARYRVRRPVGQSPLYVEQRIAQRRGKAHAEQNALDMPGKEAKYLHGHGLEDARQQA
jgi:hypothetical protein